MSVEKYADAVFQSVQTYLEKRLQELPAPRDGKDGKDGASVTIDDVAPLIAEQVHAAVKALPAPANGRDADPAAVADLVRAEVAKMIPSPVDRADVIKEIIAVLPAPRDGQSVSVADVAPMLADLVAKAVDALPKPKDGESVPVDQVQKMIDEAVSKAMAAVRMPADGGPGRDAAHIEILPAIDAEKSYPRGTYATHAGGLWRSYETTAAMKGWECIVDGDHDDDVLLADDNRTFTFRKLKSSGRVIDKSFVLPVVLDRGIFKEGTEYLPGDGCTWGGSFWIAQKKTMSKPDSVDSAFRLAVKRGRDGKDGPPGKQGEKGLDGRAGRDLTQMLADGRKV